MLIDKNRLAILKKRLLRFNDNESLSKMSLIVILALDIFVIYIIFAGLYDHTSLLTSHFEYMPNVCREAIIEKKWIDDNKIDKLQETLLSRDNSYRYKSYNYLDSSEIKKTHLVCNQLLSKINRVKESKKIIGIFRERQTVQKRQIQLAEKFKVSKDVYDTSLLETIATDSKATKISSVENSSKALSRELNIINKSIEEHNLTISKTPSVIELWQYLDELPQKKDQVIYDLKQFDFWYPIKALAWQFLFLIPLCGLFYFWNSISIRKNKNIQVLISSHLLVVSFIPIFFKLIELILDILPHRLLETLFEILKSFNIIAIWHYLVIFLAVIFTLLAIYLIQKKLFSKEKTMRKRLTKGQCHECGRKLPLQAHHICPFCGTRQNIHCPACKENTYIAGDYCIHCGSTTRQDEEQNA